MAHECYWPETAPPPPTAKKTEEGVLISGFPDKIISTNLWATVDETNTTYMSRWTGQYGGEFMMLKGANGQRIYKMAGVEFGQEPLIIWEADGQQTI